MMRSLVLPERLGSGTMKNIKSWRPVKEWFYDVAECMVNYPVPVRSRAYQTLFWIIHEKIAVGPVSVGLFFEFPLHSE